MPDGEPGSTPCTALTFLPANHLCFGYHSRACCGLWLASQQSWLCDFCFQTVIFGSSSDFPFPNAVSLLSPAKPEAPPAPVQEKPSLSEEEIERKCKSIVDEFLHINDFKVSNVRSLLSRKVCSCGAWGCFSAETMVPSSPRGHSSSGTL